tara:strand:+ start:29 stop:244 length:216 start_codon:yes stop_codon:yes gene_type:complete
MKKDLGAMFFGKRPSSEVLGGALMSLITLAILLVLGEYLWNNVLAKVVTVVKPVTSIWQILGLWVLCSLFC